MHYTNQMAYHFYLTSIKCTADVGLLNSESISTYCTTAKITASTERAAVILTFDTAKTCSDISDYSC